MLVEGEGSRVNQPKREVVPMVLPGELEGFFGEVAVVCPHALLIELGLADQQLQPGMAYFLADKNAFLTLDAAMETINGVRAQYEEVMSARAQASASRPFTEQTEEQVF
ncbi:hypothetical protein KA082_02325 [Candidatus Woesebacteria bacterium]|nr:hypothetical protein [Candidatus Woesebacteria bacterium]